MEKNLQRIFLGSLSLTLILLIVAVVALLQLPEPSSQLGLDFYQMKIDTIKYVFGGVLIGALGLIIPQLLATAQYNYKLLIEGRTLYSRAKTGIHYLPYKLPYLSYKEALDLIEKLHQAKHKADFYTDNNGKEYRIEFEKFKAFEKLRAMVQEISKEEYTASTENKKIQMLQEAFKKIL